MSDIQKRQLRKKARTKEKQNKKPIVVRVHLASLGRAFWGLLIVGGLLAIVAGCTPPPQETPVATQEATPQVTMTPTIGSTDVVQAEDVPLLVETPTVVAVEDTQQEEPEESSVGENDGILPEFVSGTNHSGAEILVYPDTSTFTVNGEEFQVPGDRTTNTIVFRANNVGITVIDEETGQELGKLQAVEADDGTINYEWEKEPMPIVFYISDREMKDRLGSEVWDAMTTDQQEEVRREAMENMTPEEIEEELAQIQARMDKITSGVWDERSFYIRGQNGSEITQPLHTIVHKELNSTFGEIQIQIVVVGRFDVYNPDIKGTSSIVLASFTRADGEQIFLPVSPGFTIHPKAWVERVINQSPSNMQVRSNTGKEWTHSSSRTISVEQFNSEIEDDLGKTIVVTFIYDTVAMQQILDGTLHESEYDNHLLASAGSGTAGFYPEKGPEEDYYVNDSLHSSKLVAWLNGGKIPDFAIKSTNELPALEGIVPAQFNLPLGYD